MPAQSVDRPSRRTVTRRRVVVDDGDDSDTENVETTRQDDDEEEFTPAPAKKTRASPRRRTMAEPPTTPGRRTTASRRLTATTESIEPSQIFSPPESVAEEPGSPSKRSPPKRRTVKDARAARKSRVSLASTSAMSNVALPTPEPSATPEPIQRQSTPLTDITETAINEQTPRATPKLSTPSEEEEVDETVVASTSQQKPESRPDVKPIDANATKLENPMDIVVRTRAIGVSQAHIPAVPKQRLTITYLILTNFKSYAGRQQIGPFHASFSSVIGPNGSGKSNVIDSLLFVFGFRASKMRQGKISALIHNSANFPDLDYCEVEVQFQEVEDVADGGHNVMPDSRLIISRRAFKNNSSKYYINGRESTFTVVTTLLRDKGIDLDHKRFLILQGEVESIAQMKPKAATEHDDGLLEYLEDIIGTSKYKTPIEEAAGETETLNEVCLEKNNRVQHVEKERNGLEGKKDRALAYIRDENELASKQSSLYQIYVAECNDNIEVTEEACSQIQEELDAEVSKHKGRDTEIKRLEKQYKAGCQEYEKLERDTETIIKESAKLEKEAVKFEEKKKFLTNKVKKLEKALDAAKFGVTESETAAKRSVEDVTRLNDEIAALERDMATEEKELAKIRDSLKGKTQGLSDQIAAKQKLLEPWSAKISDKQSSQAVARSELDILVERQTAGATAVAEVEGKIATLQEQQEQKQSEMSDCKSRHKSSLKELDATRKKLDQLKSQEPALLSKLSGARQKADEARASLSATQSQGTVLSSLTRLKESGRIDGFHGRLGNLGAIDSRYDVAISTACPALDNLVVDTVEVGQQCIEYLRKNNLGRANFILLDRLARRDMSKIQTPENVPRLFDLVKSRDARFLPAFYSVLQNTLVANDLVQANRIAYGAQRWRVVTLDGQLIDKSGTMSGGGTRVAKGGMSSKVAADTTQEQVKRYEGDRDALEASYAELQASIRDLQTRLTDLESEGPRLETLMQKLDLEIGSIDADIADARTRVKELSASAQPKKSDRGKMSSLEKLIDTLQTEIENLQSETAGIEDEIKELQDKLMQIGGVKLRAQKAKVDGLKEQIDSINEAISAAETAKVKAEKQQKKHLQAVIDAEAEMNKLSTSLAQIETDVINHSQRSASAKEEAEAAEQALDDKKEDNAQLKSQLDALIAEVNDTRTVELEIRNKLEENNKILADNQKRLKYWSEKLSKLTVQNISDDGEEREPETPPELSRDELADLDKEDLKAAIAILEERTSQPVELSVLAEYRRRVNEHKTRLDDLNSALAARDVAKKRADELRRLRLEGFMQGFSIISMRLKEMYQMITMGGNAELELVDSLDPFSEGILFSVMPPKKSWKNISNLSGGEKTLSSLALVFALHHYKPTPLYVMDEIDAALDFRNVSIVAAYIKERTKNAQFIVISLRNNMFELASRLVGVYKVNHMTKSATIENKDYVNGSS